MRPILRIYTEMQLRPAGERHPTVSNRARFSKPVLGRRAGQDSVAELLARRDRTGRSAAAATIAAGVERAPSPAPRDRRLRCRYHGLQLRGPHSGGRPVIDPTSARVVLLDAGRVDFVIVLGRVGGVGAADQCCNDPGFHVRIGSEGS